LSDGDRVEHYGPSADMGALATEWLVALAGESSYYELLKQHGAITSFPIAFERTFELDLDEFYRTYEIWRESGFPPDLAGVRQ
ncbi:MAG: hypothetical protein OXG42_03365, partial [Chloroflexi bacterium]|nr:hypothetical protein [Chloroflexota bacterium]